jgi:hypothetical protein
MSQYYSLSAEEKTWRARFEPLLDPSQWPVHVGGGAGLCPGRGHEKDAEGEMEEEVLP